MEIPQPSEAIDTYVVRSFIYSWYLDNDANFGRLAEAFDKDEVIRDSSDQWIVFSEEADCINEMTDYLRGFDVDVSVDDESAKKQDLTDIFSRELIPSLLQQLGAGLMVLKGQQIKLIDKINQDMGESEREAIDKEINTLRARLTARGEFLDAFARMIHAENIGTN